MKESKITIEYTINEETDHIHTEVEADGDFQIDDFALLLANCSTALKLNTAELFLITYRACQLLKEKKENDE